MAPSAIKDPIYQNLFGDLIVSKYIPYNNIGPGRHQHVCDASRKNRVAVVHLSVTSDEAYEPLKNILELEANKYERDSRSLQLRNTENVRIVDMILKMQISVILNLESEN